MPRRGKGNHPGVRRGEKDLVSFAASGEGRGNGTSPWNPFPRTPMILNFQSDRGAEMKLSRKWLNEFVDVAQVGDRDFAESMTLSGAKV